MNTRLLYLEHSDIFEFEANILEKISLPDGMTGVYLESTYFYPNGGGQECDHGLIGAARVVDVYKDPQEEKRVIHVLDRDIPIGVTTATIDPQRRIMHMQHHTAQHILSQCFLKELGLETVSVKICADAASTLDLETLTLAEADQERIETKANRIIFEDRAVKTYYVTQAQAQKLSLRRQPTVEKDIRIVEIEGLDMTPCGGTHCSSTGRVGMIKLLRSEHVNSGKVRLHFAAGWRTLDILREHINIIRDLSVQLNTATGDIVAASQRQAQQLNDARQALQAAQNKLIPLEAGQLVENGKEIEGRKVVFAQFDNRPPNEVRSLAEALTKINGTVAALLNTDGQKFTLIVCCADGSRISARELLQPLLASSGGRGGGDQHLAQGGGSISSVQLKSSLQNMQAVLEEFVGKSS